MAKMSLPVVLLVVATCSGGVVLGCDALEPIEFQLCAPYVESARVSESGDLDYGIAIRLTEVGKTALSDAARSASERKVTIVVDEIVLVPPIDPSRSIGAPIVLSQGWEHRAIAEAVAGMLENTPPGMRCGVRPVQ